MFLPPYSPHVHHCLRHGRHGNLFLNNLSGFLCPFTPPPSPLPNLHPSHISKAARNYTSIIVLLFSSTIRITRFKIFIFSGKLILLFLFEKYINVIQM